MKSPRLFHGLLFLSLLFSSCASMHPGQDARVIDGDDLGLRVSARSARRDPDASFELVEVTFENLSDAWVKLDSAELLVSDEDATRVSAVIGKDLADWATAMETKARLDAQNKSAFMTAVALAGVGAAIAGATTIDSNSSPSAESLALTAAGGLAISGVYAYAVSQVYMTDVDYAESPRWVPSEHVYAPFSIPGKLFVRKWLLVNRPSQRLLGNLVLKLKTVDARESIVEVSMR